MNAWPIFFFGFLGGASTVLFLATVMLWDIKRSVRRIVEEEINAMKARMERESIAKAAAEFKRLALEKVGRQPHE